MTINLPRTNQTGKNEWSDVESNDVALKEAIESLETKVEGIEGLTWKTAKAISTEQSRESTEYGFLTTEDKIAEVVLAENGLIAVSYTADWKQSVGEAGRAAIFLGENQLKVVRPSVNKSITTAAAMGTGGGAFFSKLISCPLGLYAGPPTGENYAGDATTGTTVAIADNTESPKLELNGSVVTLSSLASTGGVCLIKAAAGTYTIGVKYKATSGSVTVKNRLLQVWTLG